MYKYLEYKGTHEKYKGEKYPIRMSNMAMEGFQEETGNTNLKDMSVKDWRILLKHALKWGHTVAEKEYNLTERDVMMLVDDNDTFLEFVEVIKAFSQTPQKKGTKA